MMATFWFYDGFVTYHLYIFMYTSVLRGSRSEPEQCPENQDTFVAQGMRVDSFVIPNSNTIYFFSICPTIKSKIPTLFRRFFH